MDLDTWLAETATQPPCGPSLEYDSDYLALLTLAAGKPEQQYGETVFAAEEPDWRAVEQQASALLARTKDLRIAVHLVRARTHTAGLVGTAEGVHLIRELLERYWDAVHPQLTIDGETDPFVRMSAAAALADPEGLVRDVRSAEFCRSALGVHTFRFVERNVTASSAEPQEIPIEQLQGAVRDALAAGQEPPRAVLGIAADLKAIQDLFSERLGSEWVPDFAALLLPLQTLGKLVSSVTPKAAAGAEESQESTAEASAPVAGGAAMVVGAIRDRQSALRALDSVCEFLERSEPTNPAPLLIRRAQRLMTMSFMDIVRDMAPDSVPQVELIAGTRES